MIRIVSNCIVDIKTVNDGGLGSIGLEIMHDQLARPCIGRIWCIVMGMIRCSCVYGEYNRVVVDGW